MYDVKKKVEKQIFKTRYDIMYVEYYDKLLYILVKKNINKYIVIIGKIKSTKFIAIDRISFSDKSLEHDVRFSILCAGIFAISTNKYHYVYNYNFFNQKIKGIVPKYWQFYNTIVDLDKIKVLSW